MFPSSFAALAVLGTQAAAQRSPKNRLSSPILGSQPAAAPAGDRDVAAISNYEQRRVLSGYVMTDSNIKTAVNAWISNATAAESTYGHISTWETSRVTDMSYLFCGSSYDYLDCNTAAASFNEDISAWDTSGVKTMKSMFASASAFDQDLGGWAVHSVTDMVFMFNGAVAFNQDLGWCVDDGVDLGSAFYRTPCEATSCGVVRCPTKKKEQTAPYR